MTFVTPIGAVGVTPPTGLYLGSPTTSPGAFAMAVGSLRVAPLSIPRSYTINAIRLEVTVASTGGTLVAVLYNADPSTGLPTTLAVSSVFDSTIVGEAENVIPQITLSSGLYWIGALPLVSGCTVRAASNVSSNIPSPSTSIVANLQAIAILTGLSAPPPVFGTPTWLSTLTARVLLKAA